MQQYDMARTAIAEKARSERLYMSYALTLAVLLALGGAVLIVLGVGDHLDIVVQGTGDVEARFINASPGVALWLVSAAVFWLAKPRRLEADVSHGGSSRRLMFGMADAGHADIMYARAPDSGDSDSTPPAIEAQLREASASLGKITRMSEERLHALTEQLESYLRREAHILLGARGEEAPQRANDSMVETERGRGRVFYQSDRGQRSTASPSDPNQE